MPFQLRKVLVFFCVSFLLLGTSFTHAQELKVDASKSKVNIVFTQMNVAVEAQFKKFQAAITYNQNKPELNKASVTIDLASFDLGDINYNSEVLKPDWFHTAKYPQATFVSSNMKATPQGGLLVSGKLTIKGKSILTQFPISIKKQGTQYIFQGSLPIKRRAFNIGEGDWEDTELVADTVLIKFYVVTTQ